MAWRSWPGSTNDRASAESVTHIASTRAAKAGPRRHGMDDAVGELLSLLDGRCDLDQSLFSFAYEPNRGLGRQKKLKRRKKRFSHQKSKMVRESV